MANLRAGRAAHLQHPTRAGASLFLVMKPARPLRFCVPAACALVFAFGPPSGKAQDQEDVAKTLELAAKAEPKEALRHLTKVIKELETDKTLTKTERLDLTGRVAQVLSEKTRLPEDVLAVMGPKTSKQVVRQIYYRRHLEYWLYERPLRIGVILEHNKGQDPFVRAIFSRPAEMR